MSTKLLEYRIRIVTGWIKEYQGEEPLSAFLKKQFQQNKKFGSNDRKILSDMMYNFYRTGRYGDNFGAELKLLFSLYLFHNNHEVLNQYITERTGISDFPADFKQRLKITDHTYKLSRYDLFPFSNHISEKLDRDNLISSLAGKPFVWIRLRKNHKNLYQNLSHAGYLLTPSTELDNAYFVSNPKGLENTPQYQKGQLEIQDLASQICSSLIKINQGAEVWDACAGSGGKSLFLLDNDPELRINCTDIRPTILKNLETRMQRTGHKNVQTKVMDIADPAAKNYWQKKWKYIVADVPCSGSGTWSRTPEQVYFFNEKEIEKYSNLQKKILSNLSDQLDTNGSIFYLTCSIFSAENELITNWAIENIGFEKKSENLIEGYKMNADSMYFCHLKKL